jgi:hypothetical protein
MANGINMISTQQPLWPQKNDNFPKGPKEFADMVLVGSPLDTRVDTVFKLPGQPLQTRAWETDHYKEIESRLDLIAETNPKFAAEVRAEVMSRLSPIQQGELERFRDGIMTLASNGHYFNLAEPSPDLPSQDEWLDRAKIDGHPDYAEYVAIAGSENRDALKQAMNDVAERRKTLQQDITVNGGKLGEGWSVLNKTAQGVETANTFGLKPLANVLQSSDGTSKLMTASKVTGRVAPVVGFGAQYMENRANGHSKFVSGTGATASTVGPVLSGALIGGAAGLAFDGVGAPVGAVTGAYIGWKHSDEINKSGLTTGQFIEKKIENFDATKIEDSKGVTLGDALDRWLSPQKGQFDK